MQANSLKYSLARVVTILVLLNPSFAFVLRPRLQAPYDCAKLGGIAQTRVAHLNLGPADFTSSSSLVIAAESWRQYVAAAVIFGVVLDIVLGSPLANTVLKPLRPEEMEEDKSPSPVVDRSKERINTEQFAKDAMERAEGALELRRYLEERKTDFDRMEDLKRKLDSDMQDLDADLQAREESLAKRRTSD